MLSLLYLRKSHTGGYLARISKTAEGHALQPEGESIRNIRFIKGDELTLLTKKGTAYVSVDGAYVKVDSTVKFVDCASRFLISREGNVYMVIDGKAEMMKSALKFVAISGEGHLFLLDTEKELWAFNQTPTNRVQGKTPMLSLWKAYYPLTLVNFNVDSFRSDFRGQIVTLSDHILRSGYSSRLRSYDVGIPLAFCPFGDTETAVIDKEGMVSVLSQWTTPDVIPDIHGRDILGDRWGYVILEEDWKTLTIGKRENIGQKVDERFRLVVEGGVYKLLTKDFILTKKRI